MTTRVTTKLKFFRILVTLTGILFTLSFFSQLYFSSKFAVKGDEMNKLMHRQAELTKEISKLDLRISEVSSLAVLEDRAHKMGFVPMNGPVSVIKAPSVAVATNLK